MKAKLYTLGVIFLLSTSLAAQTGGTCGTNATWSFADSTLTISGTGALSNYYYPNKVPWDSLKNRIAVVNICEGITSFANVTFSEYNSLRSFTLPSTVTTVESALLRSCASLTSIIVDPNNAVYDSRENCNAIIETAINKLVVGCKNSVIPTTVVSIGNSAFYRCFGLTNITIPNGVTSIGSTAFLDCTSLNAITIPNSVTTIGEQAFVNCSLITTIDIPNSVTSLGKKAFYHCSALTSATISDNITTIEANTFLECINLTSVTLGNNLAPPPATTTVCPPATSAPSFLGTFS